jgi:hypothetical protein
MSLYFEERLSDSPYIEKVTQGWTVSAGGTVRPAEVNWHMVFVRHCGVTQTLMVGPWSSSGNASWGGDAEILWVKFKLGAFIPHLPTKNLLNSETPLPGANSKTFWLKGAAWQLPNYDNVETFINRLVRDDLLVSDPIVTAALRDELSPAIPARTVRHRFLQSTGLTQTHIRQFERAQYAASLLAQGKSILDTVYEAGYFDQPHLTRAMKRFTGQTPAQHVVEACQPVA